MQTILLTKGHVTVVDDCDFETLSAFKWCALEVRRRDGYLRTYAVRRDRTPGKNRKVYMHREVARLAGMSTDKHVDHEDGNPLNNTRGNVRACSSAENARNRPKNRNNKSGFKGVHLDARTGRWVAQICADSRQVWLGYFDTPENAHEAYCQAAASVHGEFARTS